jgi:hypothetical protein
MARHKDIFFSYSFLALPADNLFFSALSAISAVNKKRTDLTAEHAKTAEAIALR